MIKSLGYLSFIIEYLLLQSYILFECGFFQEQNCKNTGKRTLKKPKIEISKIKQNFNIFQIDIQ